MLKLDYLKKSHHYICLHIQAPPRQNLPIITKLIESFKIWSEFLNTFPKTQKYTLGYKIDTTFIKLIECIFLTSNLPKNSKTITLLKASNELDKLKFFLQIAWEIKMIDSKKYIRISEKLHEIGRMIGGWQKQIQKENPTQNVGK